MHFKPGRPNNPAALLFAALKMRDLERRLSEALPWVVWRYSDLDWEWLVREAKLHDLQNRLGFVVDPCSAGRRAALFTSAFWITFPQFPRYRLRRLWPAGPGIAGAILLIWGLVLLFQWLLAYYAARLGHPLS